VSRNDIGTDANPERARGVPHMIAGGARRGVGGWAGFGAVALLWPPLWVVAVLSLPAELAVLAVATGLLVSALCGSVGWTAHPPVAWAALAGLAAGSVLLSLAAGFAAGPGNPWAWPDPAFVLSMETVTALSALVWLSLFRRAGTP